MKVDQFLGLKSKLRDWRQWPWNEFSASWLLPMDRHYLRQYLRHMIKAINIALAVTAAVTFNHLLTTDWNAKQVLVLYMPWHLRSLWKTVENIRKWLGRFFGNRAHDETKIPITWRGKVGRYINTEGNVKNRSSPHFHIIVTLLFLGEVYRQGVLERHIIFFMRKTTLD